MANETHSRRRLFAALPAAAIAATTTTTTNAAQKRAPAARRLDLDSAWGNLEGYLRARSDISGAASVSWTSGYVYGQIPGQKARRLLLGQGVKCTRCIRDARGYEFLERECVIFSDPDSGEPLRTWRNPYTERTVEVFHIMNASAGSHLAAEGPEGPFHKRYMEHSGDVTFYDDFFYSRPSELNTRDYAPYAAADVYEGAGIYHFHAHRADLDDRSLSSVPVTTSHTGIRQWLPWMEMGAWAGGCVLPSRGKKLRGVAEIPQPLLGWLENTAPEYLDAPVLADQARRRTFYGQFREHIDRKRASEAR